MPWSTSNLCRKVTPVTLKEGTELPVTLTDARAALELVAATYYSSETNAPVSLPIGPDHPKYQRL